MNGAHLHLLVNHIPVFAVVMGLAALIWAMVRNSNDMRLAAVCLFVLAGAFGFIAAETGDKAEDIIKHMADISEVAKPLIHQHEEAADFANVVAVILAVAAVAMVLIERFKKRFFSICQIAVLVLALTASAAMARTAYLGGLIRHTEIRGDYAQPIGGAGAPVGKNVQQPEHDDD
mgnify:CR=1 FL=1